MVAACKCWRNAVDLHLHDQRFELRASALGYTWCLRTATSAHGRICSGTSRVLSAPSLRWTTWANWCRVRDFHPQPLRSERSVSCRWTDAAKIVNRKSHIVNEIGTPGRTLACNLPVLSGAPLLVGLTRRESEDPGTPELAR